MRGPAVLPDRPGVPQRPTDRERFDAVVVGVVQGLEERWRTRLGLVEYAVEDAPQLDDDWDAGLPGGPGRAPGSPVPLSSLVRGSSDTPAKIVVFRRPIEHRCESRRELQAMVHAVVVEQVAELLELPPEDVDPGYGADAS